jgi:hypothetical protein
MLAHALRLHETNIVSHIDGYLGKNKSALRKWLLTSLLE